MKKTTTQMIAEHQEKLEELKERHQKMKEVNAHYRKEGTLRGSPHREILTAWMFDSGITRTAFWKPFSKETLQSSRQHIQREKERLAFLRERFAEEKEAALEAAGAELGDAKKRAAKRPSIRGKIKKYKEIKAIGGAAAEERDYKTGRAAKKPSLDLS